MNNAMSRIANSLFGSRETPEVSHRPSVGMLGSGLASNSASKALMNEYQTRSAIAQANGEEFPSFEDWIIQRR